MEVSLSHRTQNATFNADLRSNFVPSAHWTMEDINSEEIKRLSPLIVFLLLISLTGILGNGLVCFIYRTKFTVSSSRWFIFFLASVDLFMCVIIIPCEIGTTFMQYTFTSDVFCKVTAFFNLWSLLSLGFTLVVVSVDRYRKVCTPLGWQINYPRARSLSVGAVLLALLISLPSLLMYSVHETMFDVDGTDVTSYECTSDTSESSWVVIYVGGGMTMFVASLVSMSVLYCFIGKEIKYHIERERIKRHVSLTASMARKNNNIIPVSSVDMADIVGMASPKRVQFGNVSNETKPKKSVNFTDVKTSANDVDMTCSPMSPRATRLASDDSLLAESVRSDVTSLDDDAVVAECALEVPKSPRTGRLQSTGSLGGYSVRSESTSNEDEPSSSHQNYTDEEDVDFIKPQQPLTRREKTKSKRIRRARAKKATFSMFLISLAFVLSYCPFLCLLLARTVISNFEDSLSDAERVAYKFFLRSYFLNCAINPFIYGMSDSKFRTSCADALKNIRRGFHCTKEKLSFV